MDYHSERSRIRRVAKRGHYDAETVHRILDAHYVGQVSFQAGEQPFQIPMLYARKNRILYLHGSTKSRIYRTLRAGLAGLGGQNRGSPEPLSRYFRQKDQIPDELLYL